MIVRSTQGQVAVLIIDRQRQRNALDIEHCVALAGELDAAAGEGARCVVLTGAGSAFCSGADLDAVYDASFRDALYDLLAGLVTCPLPVLAAVNGPAIGAGTQLALASDLRVAGPSAVFGIPTARLGLAVDPWTVARLAQLTGAGPAARLLLEAVRLDAEQAARHGLVEHLLVGETGSDGEAAGPLAAAIALAHQLAELAPLTLAYNKHALRAGLPLPGTFANDDLRGAFDACWASEDFQEGRVARTEQRPPVFRGR